MDRRTFLKGATAVLALTAVPLPEPVNSVTLTVENLSPGDSIYVYRIVSGEISPLLVWAAGLEPTTPAVQGRYSTD